MATKKLVGVQTQHPEYTAMLKTWKRCNDAADGEKQIHEGKTAYLPMLKKELTADYNKRRNRTPWFNATARTIAGLKGMVFRKEPQVETAASITESLNDIDMAGSPLDVFAQNLVINVLRTGRAGILVDFPQNETDEDMSEAQAAELGLRPMIVKYPAVSIINWKVERVFNVMKTTLVVLAEVATLDGTDEYEHKTEKRYRVLDLKQTLANKGTKDESIVLAYRQRVFTSDNKGNDTQIGSDIFPEMNNQLMDEIPFFFVSPDDIGASVSKPPLLDLIDMNVHHYAVSSDYEHGCHLSGLATLFLFGYTVDDSNPEIRIGGAAANAVPDAEAHAEYLEVTGDFGALRANLNAKKSEMAVLGARLLEGEKEAVESDKTLRQRSLGEQSQLAAMTEIISMVLTAALQVFSDWSGAEGKVSYKLNKDFMPEGMSPEDLTAKVEAWQAGAFSKQVLFENLQRGEVITQETTFEEEQERIASQTLIPPNEDE